MTLSHAINNIKNYKKKYGFGKAFRAFYHYGYLAIKKTQLNFSKEETIEVNGYKITVMPNDLLGTSSELRVFKSHEPVTTQLISRELEQGMTCLDIGGNIGYYALLESKIVGKTGKVIAIEPSPENVRYLEKNLKLQNSSNIEVLNIAAGDKDGNLKFLIYEDAANSCMVIPEGQESKYPGKVIQVPVKRIDSLLQEIPLERLDLVRMDVEGYEFHIFEGMLNTIRKFKPIIQLEVHKNIMGKENSKKFLEGLKNEGYEVKYFIPRDIDVPLIGSIKDVKNYSIDKLLKMLEENSLPSFFMLTLKNTSSLI